MCGRYSLDARPEEIVEAFEILDRISFTARYNIAPTQDAPVIRLDRDREARRLDVIRWGLTPSAGGRLVINARSETAATRGLFKHALRSRRCLVPATGFFEWQRLGDARQPFNIHVKERPLFAFAGIWGWSSTPDDDRVDSFVILTTEPNRTCAPIHDRMPVILAPGDYATWLDTSAETLEPVQTLLRPAPDEQIAAYPVSRLVNRTENDEPACIAPIEADGMPTPQPEFDW